MPVKTVSRPQTGQTRSESCRYPPPRQLTKEDLAKAYARARRADDASDPIRLYNYQKHRDRVLTARPVVDCKSPIVGKTAYASPTNFNRSIAQFVHIERENARMLQRIGTIMKGPASVDNRLRSTTFSINVRSRAREMDLLRIAFDNFEMYKRISTVKATYSREQQLKDFDKAEKIMELSSYYPLHWKTPPPSLYTNTRDQALANAQNNPLPKVFLQLETDAEVLGHVVIELRADIVPMTAENFRCLCTGEMGLSYKCSQIHRIVPGYLWQGGDVVGKDGRGSASIYGNNFPDENFKLKHKEAGTVSMSNFGEKDTNGSQFIITAKPLAALDGVNVVVGKVVSGMEILEKLNSFVTSTGGVRKKVWITNCGSADGDEYENETSYEQYDADDERNEIEYQPEGPPTGTAASEPPTDSAVADTTQSGTELEE